eukprot:TRINITY_DN984_c2_g1_i5.p1 TRINITY_DN984_c2_g1~~TRINITY_DN984_c2_g1_i5.p1  ORF type:complete len:189 (+),score=25.91 TRINITY_DN984_c2_g1_i5:88-654(+)
MVNPPNPTATFTTSFGRLKIEIFEDDVPETACNFIDLVQKGFYTKLRFHDLKPGFAFYTGCPNTALGLPKARQALVGTGGPVPGTEFTVRRRGKPVERDSYGFIKDEKTAKHSNTYGTVSMANCGPDTNGSIFFVNMADNTHLDWWDKSAPDSNVVFGKIISGMDDIEDLAHSFWGAYQPFIYSAVMD